jgi:hypothetical protein
MSVCGRHYRREYTMNTIAKFLIILLLVFEVGYIQMGL